MEEITPSMWKGLIYPCSSVTGQFSRDRSGQYSDALLLSVGKRRASDYDRLRVDQDSASNDCQKNSNRVAAAVKPLGSSHSCGDYIIRSAGGVARLIPGSGLV